MSQLTTHILDTAKGKPAADVAIVLYQYESHNWHFLAEGKTDNDGRINNLLADDMRLPHGSYKMKFMTADYFLKQQVGSFYPFVEVVFEITSADHYHIPLLLSPFGYTTYRGS